MSRLNIRCKVSLPVTVSLKENESETTREQTKFSNLSLGGGLILSENPYPPKKRVNLKCNLPKHGELEFQGEIVRSYDTGSVAATFQDVHKDDKVKLWEYLREHITDIRSCPYCRNENISNVSKCQTCGLNLDFDSPDYLVEHEKWLFLKKLAIKSDFFSLEDIARILNFVDMEILNIVRKSSGKNNVTESKTYAAGPVSEALFNLYKNLSDSTSLKKAKSIIEKQKLIDSLEKHNNNI